MSTKQAATKKPLLKQEKSKGKRWQPGQSGNPKGRPRGTGKVAEMRDSIAEHIPGILNQVVKAAKNGDIQAARLLLDRTIPTLKPAEETITLALPDGTITDQGRAVLAAVAAGEVPPGQASQIIAAIAAMARVAEIDELEQRLAALEGENEK